MSACKYETFKRTAHPSQSRTNVMFCGCKGCMAARFLERKATRLEQCGEKMRPRLEALRWKPEPDREQVEDEAS